MNIKTMDILWNILYMYISLGSTVQKDKTL